MVLNEFSSEALGNRSETDLSDIGICHDKSWREFVAGFANKMVHLGVVFGSL